MPGTLKRGAIEGTPQACEGRRYHHCPYEQACFRDGGGTGVCFERISPSGIHLCPFGSSRDTRRSLIRGTPIPLQSPERFYKNRGALRGNLNDLSNLLRFFASRGVAGLGHRPNMAPTPSLKRSGKCAVSHANTPYLISLPNSIATNTPR